MTFRGRASLGSLRDSYVIDCCFLWKLQLIVLEPTAAICVLYSMDFSVLYRQYALECLREARAVKGRELRNVFHRLAMWWTVLAHEIEGDHRFSGRFQDVGVRRS